MSGGRAPLPDGGHLRFVDEGAGPAVVLVSGLGGQAAFFADLGERLRAEGFRTLRYDHRGVCGSSALAEGPTSIEAMADDLLALLDACEVGRAMLLGHSTGGAIAQRLSLRRPDRVERLVLSATFARPCDYMRRLFESRLEILARLGAAAYRRHAALILNAPSWIASNASRLDEELERADRTARPGEAETIAARVRAILAHDASAELPGLLVPTLVLVATDDVVTPPYLSRDLVAAIPGARLEILPGGGHYAIRADLDRYAAPVLAFLLQSHAEPMP